MHAGYDQAPRTACSRRSTGRSTATGCSRSATSSATATGSTASSRATACSCPASSSSRSAGSTRASPCPAAATPTSTCSSGSPCRPASRPRASLGEGTFHQFHGGTTTNVADDASAVPAGRLVPAALRGAPRADRCSASTGPSTTSGAMATKAARRTRSRRVLKLGFDTMRDPTQVGTARAAAGRGEARRDRGRLGPPGLAGVHVAGAPRSTGIPPISTSTRSSSRSWPTVVVLAADDDGLAGRALFAASVCDQLGVGRVVAVGRRRSLGPSRAPPDHPPGRAARRTPPWPSECRPGAGAGERLVILGLGHVERVVGAFEHYAPLVPVGGYVVVENTVVNGRPVASGYGPGPHEAVVAILGRHPDFVADPRRRALHGDLQRWRLPAAGPVVTTESAAALVLRAHAQDGRAVPTASGAVPPRRAIYPRREQKAHASLYVDLLLSSSGSAATRSADRRPLPAVHHRPARRAVHHHHGAARPGRAHAVVAAAHARAGADVP